MAVTASAAVAVSVFLFKGLAHIFHEYVEYRVESGFIVGAFKFHRAVVVGNHFENNEFFLLFIVLFRVA